jgi:hypothetical protein
MNGVCDTARVVLAAGSEILEGNEEMGKTYFPKSAAALFSMTNTAHSSPVEDFLYCINQ